MMNRNVLFVVAILVAAAVGLYLFFPFDREMPSRISAARPVLVEVDEVKMGTVRDRVEAVGTTRAAKAVDVVPLVSGRVEEIRFTPGQRVKAKSALVKLNRGAALAHEQETRAELDRAKVDYDRAQVLLKSPGSISQSVAEEREAAYLIAKAKHEAAVDALDERTIDAPFDGTVGFKNVDVGAFVNEGTVLTTLDDLRTIEIEFSIPESYYRSIKKGMPVGIRTLAFGRKRFRGSIAEIDTRVDPVSRSFRVKASLPNEAEEIPSGMFMNVRVIIDRRDAIVIPLEALVFRGMQTFVYLAENGVARQHVVTLGLRQRKTAEVIDGLEVGDKLIVKGLQSLRDGVPIKIVTSDPASAAAAVPSGGSQ